MSALTSYRVFRREAAGFDGATAETATYTQLRHVFSTPTTTAVGRFEPSSLNRYNVVSLGRIALEGVIAPGDEIRIVDSSGQTRFTRPASVESSGWFFLLPEDVIEIDAAGATAADIIIDDLTDPQILQAALVEIGNGAIAPAQTSITVTEATTLPAYAGHLIVFVEPAVDEFDITLPTLADVPLDSRITFVRVRGAANPANPRVITDVAGTQVNGGSGIDDSAYFLRSEQDSTTYLRVDGGWVRRQGFQAPQRISSTDDPIVIPAWQEGTLYVNDANIAQGTVVQLPPILDCREGCRLVLSASPAVLIEAVVHALTADPGDFINFASEFLFTASSSTSIVTVELTGGQWRAVSNNADLITFSNPVTTAPGALAPKGGQAIERVVLAADGDIVLPDPAELPHGSSVTVVRTGGAGTPRVITDDVTTEVNGVAGLNPYYLNGIGQSITYRREGGGSWTRPQGTGAPDPIVSAANVVITPFLGEQYVTTTGGAGQTVTLPGATSVAVGSKVYMYNSSANAHSIVASVGDTILGAPSQPIGTASGFVAYTDGSNDWKGWVTPV
jgi:hypothetical protein